MLTLVDVFYTLVKIPFYSCLAKTLFINIGFCQLVYLLLLRWLCCFSSQFNNMLKCAHWFSGVWNIWWLLKKKKKKEQQNATCIPALNPTSSFFVLSLFYITGFNLLKISFWRIFFISVAGGFWSRVPFVLILSGFGIRVMLASLYKLGSIFSSSIFGRSLCRIGFISCLDLDVW